MISPLKFSRHAAWKRPHSTGVSYTRSNSTRHLSVPLIRQPDYAGIEPRPRNSGCEFNCSDSTNRVELNIYIAHVPRHASSSNDGRRTHRAILSRAGRRRMERGRVYRESNRTGSHPRGATVFIYRGAHRTGRFKRRMGEGEGQKKQATTSSTRRKTSPRCTGCKTRSYRPLVLSRVSLPDFVRCIYTRELDPARSSPTSIFEWRRESEWEAEKGDRSPLSISPIES